MNGLRKEFTTFSIVLIAVGIGLNIGVGQVPRLVGLPLYLDSIGTVLVAVLVGPWAGAVTGFLANVVWTLTGLFPQAIAWAGVAAIIGVLASVFARSGWFQLWWRALVAGLITGIVAAVFSAPIAAYVFGGVTGSGTDLVVGMFRAAGLDMLGANMAQGVVSDPIDKGVSFLLVWAVMQALPQRFKASLGSAVPTAKARTTRKSKSSARRRRR